ncbi:hypothetical protein K2173_025638 [Erythroxylum novogranatense]|uniref:Protein kinase domain-containing protein n=1 Tax=Erythroxylum novogranatense TaxID=1862640 RepID=A0AAV8SMX7_9ROSI|nr:hypothetical protein K2173_025638 [Erythroxylum novogranatense]
MEGEVIIVGVDAAKEITDYALEWAVCNAVTKPTDVVIVLAVLPQDFVGRHPLNASYDNNHYLLPCLPRRWSIGGGRHRNSREDDDYAAALVSNKAKSQQIMNACMHMMRQLCLEHNKQLRGRVTVTEDAGPGSVGKVARDMEATWVILDRHLKKEGDICVRQLNCNIVIVDHALSIVLKSVSSVSRKNSNKLLAIEDDKISLTNDNFNSATTGSSLGMESPNSDSDVSMSLSSAEKGKSCNCTPSPSSEYSMSNGPPVFRLDSGYMHYQVDAQTACSSPSTSNTKSWITDTGSTLMVEELCNKSSTSLVDRKVRSHRGNLGIKNGKIQSSGTPAPAFPARRSTGSMAGLKKPRERLSWQLQPISRELSEQKSSPSEIERTSSIRRAMSLSLKRRPTPPPLCSICKHNTPAFGKSPRKFSYKEIELATNGFSQDNLLAEGGNGSVYKGILADGQVVAVKQYNTVSARGASEFCSEVEVLSCAQHRNLVMLVGYCIETKWLLIYEYACNGSLDKHLYNRKQDDKVMAWHERMKVAIGAARGLRYLHEDCRVGCIVHRDFRPNNVLLTHDFEPMVGDFGLARWQVDGQLAEETRVIGAFGYLAPEYTQSGLVTEKTDVYAFGVVLLELLSGIRSTEFSRSTGKQFVLQLGIPLLKKKTIKEMIDPLLGQDFHKAEVDRMMYAASLCLSPNPEGRPRMSKVLKILEGDMPIEYPPNNRKRGSESPRLPVNNLYHSKTVNRTSGLSSELKTSSPSNEHKVTTRGIPSHRAEVDVSGEYRSYLHGSLTKFFGSLDTH